MEHAYHPALNGNAGAQGQHRGVVIAPEARAVLADGVPAGVQQDPSLDLFLCQAENLAGSGIGAQDGALPILHNYTAGDGLVEPAIALLAAAQRFLGPFVLGDVQAIDP